MTSPRHVPIAATVLALLLGPFVAVATVHAQNFGLRERQSPEQLPKSAAPLQQGVRVAKRPKATVLQPAGHGEFLIVGGWELADAQTVIGSEKTLFDPALDTSRWYNATVPGTVLTTLVDQGVYPDPYHGLNNLAIPESLCRQDWWYRVRFTLPKEAAGREVWLAFDGINYRAEIWLNGQRLGTIDGAFRRGQFRVSTGVRRDAENILAVRILPPPNPGIPHEESLLAGEGPNGGQLCLDGPTFISSEGWDWVPGIHDRNIGLWQDVRLRLTGPVTIGDPQVVTDLPLPDTSRADVTVRAEIKNHSDAPQSVTLGGTIGDVAFRQQVQLGPGEAKVVAFVPEEFPQLRLRNPRLWWPNGYGRPELYTLDLTVTSADGGESNRKVARFGVRELSYELTVDAPAREGWRVEFNPISALKSGKPLFDNLNRREVGDGVAAPRLRPGVDPSLLTELSDEALAPYLVIKVNGQRIFCKGGNWGMDDAMKRVSRERLEPYVRLHRDANYNMVRNWTGESTEEVFYDLCDEYGLLVWNDFWLSTEGYNLDVNDNQLFLDNARDVIQRFRNHPSIAIWCPRNEGYAPAAIDEGLATMIAALDGTRHYQGNSRYLNLRPSGPWHYHKDPAEYFRTIAAGFNTELGTYSIPTAETIRRFIAPEDLWPINDVWYYHDLHGKHALKDLLGDIEQMYGAPSGVDDFSRKAQFTNYDQHRAMFESWNSRLWNNTAGILLWMTHPAWPSMIWQTYTYDYETNASYFGAKKANEPIHVQMNLDDGKVVVVNASLRDVGAARVRLRVIDLAGKEVFSQQQAVVVTANRLTECFTPQFPKGLPDVYLARLTLTDAAGVVLSTNDYWRSSTEGRSFQAFNRLARVRLAGRVVSRQAGRLVVEVKNPAVAPAINVKLNLRDAGTGAAVLPAYASDGYFALLPGERKLVTIEYPAATAAATRVTASGYNVEDAPIAE